MSMINKATMSASVGNSLDAALAAKTDKSEITRLDAALAGKEAAGTTGVHNDSASAHLDIRDALEKKLEAGDISCHNTSSTAHVDIRSQFTGKEDAGTAANKVLAHNADAVAHTDIRTRLDGKVDRVSGMGLSSNDFTAAEKTEVANNTAMRHNHNNKALLDSYTQSDANLSDAVERKHSHENKFVLDGITAALADGWCNAVTHISDTVKHITTAERSNWNGKADKTYVDSSLVNKANVGDVLPSKFRILNAGDDLNNYTMADILTFGSVAATQIANVPLAQQLVIFVLPRNIPVSNNVTQVAYAGDNTAFIRSEINGVWGAWQQFATLAALPNPNLLINPWFTVWQRGTSFTPGERALYTADCWYASANISSVQEAGNGIKVVTTAPWANLSQYIEQSGLLSGKTLTLTVEFASCTARPSVTLSYLRNGATTAIASKIADAGFIKGEVAVTAVIPSLQSGDLLMARFGSGTDGANTMIVSAVKLESGTASTLANDLPPNPQQELAKCQRYYIPPATTYGYGFVLNDGTTAKISIPLSAPLRLGPVLEVVENGSIRSGAGSPIVPTAISLLGIKNSQVMLSMQGDFGGFRNQTVNWVDGVIGFDANLLIG